jgi:hypothetical protein
MLLYPHYVSRGEWWRHPLQEIPFLEADDAMTVPENYAHFARGR